MQAKGDPPMNKTLTALVNKLTEQIKEIEQHRQLNMEQLRSLEKKLNEVQEKTHKACVSTTTIHPEREIARLNFIMKNQQLEENLEEGKKILETQLQQLQIRETRLNLELKMLDDYCEKKEQKTTKKQQKVTDELV